MARDLSPDDLRTLDDAALANLAAWRHAKHHRLWRGWLAERDRYDAAAQEIRRRQTNRGTCPTTPEEGNP